MSTELEKAVPQADGPGRDWGIVALICALAALVFAPELLAGGQRLIGEAGSDMPLYFYPMRQWGFSQLAHGHVPLWNPHILCGTPFFGNFQPALLYPPNWLHLVLPAAVASNWTMCLHVALAGIFTCCWARVRGMERLAGLLGALIYMFCGAFFFKIRAGWPTLVDAAAWTPLVFACADQLILRGRLRWSLVGGMAVAMQFLCGCPQFAYYTFLAVGVYALLNLLVHRQNAWRVAIGLATMYAVGVAISAAQLAAGLAVAMESTRSGGLALKEASYGMLYPSALLTLLSPYTLSTPSLRLVSGGIRFEMLNVGAVGLLLGLYGAGCGERRWRWILLALAVLACLVAMGTATPLFGLLHRYLPGFSLFRAVVRLTFMTSLMMSMLAAVGFQRLLSAAGCHRRLATAGAVAGLLLLGFAAAVYLTRHDLTHGVWAMVLKAVDQSDAIRVRPARKSIEGMVWTAASLAGAGVFMLSAAALLPFSGRRVGQWAMVVLAGVEMFVAARLSVTALPIPLRYPRAWSTAMAEMAPENRTWQVIEALDNHAMQSGNFAAGGVEAAWLLRHMMLNNCIEGSHMNEDIRQMMEQLPGLAQMLRIEVILKGSPAWVTKPPDQPMGRVALIPGFAVVQGPSQARDETPGEFLNRMVTGEEQYFPAIEVMSSCSFDPTRQVLLETDPGIRCGAPAAGDHARVVSSSSDRLEIAVETSAATVLLVTDTYSRYWKARPLAGSAQEKYEVMPANGMLRAVPLKPGSHRICMEYQPPGVAAGFWISGLATGAWALGMWAAFFRGQRPARDV